MKYTITFYTYWLCGSGLSGGSSADILAIRDEEGLPFVPGRTIKGHLREAAELLGDREFVAKCFGEAVDKPGLCHFRDAEIPFAVDPSVSKHLFKRVTTTAIDKKSGTALDDTLRTAEAVVPVTLEGEIDNVPEEYRDAMVRAMKLVKRIGMRRHRGFGRCDIRPIDEGKKS